MSVDNVTTVGSGSADRAVVGTLRKRVAVRFGPTERPAVDVHETVLLLDAEPRLRVLASLHGSLTAVSLVGSLSDIPEI